MRKFALLLAAALAVSVPLAATMSTDTYAAAKKAKKAGKKEATKKAAGPQVPFGTIIRAIDDLGRQLTTPPGGDGKVAKKRGKKGGKKARKGGKKAKKA